MNSRKYKLKQTNIMQKGGDIEPSLSDYISTLTDFDQALAKNNSIVVYTTGFGYGTGLSPDIGARIMALRSNVLKKLSDFMFIHFVHYDSAINDESAINHALMDGIISKQDVIRKENLSVDKIMAIEQYEHAHLIIDCANVLVYYSAFEADAIRPFIVYSDNPADANREKNVGDHQLIINAFYPGFLVDYARIDDILNFDFFTVTPNEHGLGQDRLRMVTYLHKITKLGLKLTFNDGDSTSEHVNYYRIILVDGLHKQLPIWKNMPAVLNKFGADLANRILNA
jgi:hypothetical protein